MSKYKVTITKIKTVNANSVSEAKQVAKSSKYPIVHSFTEIKAQEMYHFR